MIRSGKRIVVVRAGVGPSVLGYAPDGRFLRGYGRNPRIAEGRTHLVFAEHFWKDSITRHRRTKARFRFYSRDGARGFVCKRDHGRWRHCRSPLRYWVTIGHHVLRVRAVGPTGLRGPTARLRFKVTHPRRH